MKIEFVTDLEKALGDTLVTGPPAMPAAAPAAPAAGGGQRGGPGSAPRAGHKYISRKWNGYGWDYEYAQDPSSSHGMASPDIVGDPSRAHSLEIHPDHPAAAASPEEQAQHSPADKEALYNSLQENLSNTPGTHAIPHPNSPGESLQLTTAAKGPKAKSHQVHDSQGNLLFAGASKGAVDNWHAQEMHKQSFPDADGRPWLEIVPNVGQVQGGVLVPSTSPKTHAVRISTDHPDYKDAVAAYPAMAEAYTSDLKEYESALKEWESDRQEAIDQGQDPDVQDDAAPKPVKPIKPAKPRRDWQKQSLEAAQKHIEEEVNRKQALAGAITPLSEVGQVPSPEASPVESPTGASEEVQDAFANNESAKDSTQEPSKEVSNITQGGAADRLQQGDYQYKDVPIVVGGVAQRRTKKVLDVSPQEREQMIESVARDFWPAIISTARRAVAKNELFNKDPERWTTAFIGDDVKSGAGGTFQLPDKTQFIDGKPGVVGLTPGSIVHGIISDAIDNYRPTVGGRPAYFASYLAGPMKKKGGGGLLHFGTQRPRVLDEFAAHAKTGSDTAVGGSGGAYNVAEQHAANVAAGKTSTPVGATSATPEEKRVPSPEAPEAPKPKPQVVQPMRRKKVEKSLEDEALFQIAYHDFVSKAVSALKSGVDLSHTYSHMDGDPDHPSYYYTDPRGNLIRYTNAPDGHQDASSMCGSPALHPGEADAKKNSAYFTPDGRKMDRAFPEGAFPEWNQTYNRYDPQNLWIARWPQPDTGDYQYAYIDSDIRSIPKLETNRLNTLYDVRLPVLRSYVVEQFHSPNYKEQLTSIGLALLDQGCFRVHELAALTPNHIQVEGSMVYIGNRRIYADPQLQQAFLIIKRNKTPTEPLFCVPFMKEDGTPDPGLSRRLGPNYFARVLNLMGISLFSMQTYRATKTFSSEMQRLLTVYNLPWDQAMNSAVMTVALEWGHDLSQEMDIARVTQLILETLIDPVVVEVLHQKSQELGLGQGGQTGQVPPPTLLIPTVSMSLLGKTPDETEFSQWIHAYPAHSHAQMQGAA